MAAVVVFSLAPTTIMMWQALIILHAAVLPLVLWAGALGRSRRSGRVSKGLWIYAAAEICSPRPSPSAARSTAAAAATASDSFGLALRHDHPMLHELHIQPTCPWPVNEPEGWWPDVLPE